MEHDAFVAMIGARSHVCARACAHSSMLETHSVCGPVSSCPPLGQHCDALTILWFNSSHF